MIKKIGCLVILINALFFSAVFADAPKQKLNVANWSNYIAPNTISDFEKEFNVKVVYDNYSSNEELLAKLQTGVTGYDVIFPSAYTVEILLKLKLLEKINLKSLSNLNNLEPRFLKMVPTEYAIPYQWGTTGLVINTQKIKDKITSWQALWNEQYKGRVAILDDMRSGISPALKRLGFSINTQNKAELEKAKELMIQQKPITQVYTSNIMDYIQSGDVWIAQSYSGDAFQVIKQNSAITYVIPEEGGEIGLDCMSIPKGAPHKALAEAFINYILRPDVSAAISTHVGYGNPNAAAKKLLSATMLKNPGIYPSDALLAKYENLMDVGKATAFYDRIWTQIKSE